MTPNSQLLLFKRSTPPLPLNSLRRLSSLPQDLSHFIADLAAHPSNLPDSSLPSSSSDAVYDHQQSQRRSKSAQYATTRLSIIKLPPDLVDGVNQLIHSVPHRSAIRTAALGLYGKYRLTGSKQSLDQSNLHLMSPLLVQRALTGSEKSVKPKLRTTYDHLTSISFAAGAMPATYGATLKVLLETKRRLDSEQARRRSDTCWAPRGVLDYGSGTGAAAWAAAEVWPDSIKQYNGLDKSSSMIWLSEKLLAGRAQQDESGDPRPKLKTAFTRITIAPTKAQKAKHEEMAAADLADALEHAGGEQAGVELPPSPYAWTGDTQNLLAIMSFTLSDLPNQAARRQAVDGMWNSGAELLVVIDRGTPAGFQVVADARQQLLMLGRRASRQSQQDLEADTLSSGRDNNPTATANASQKPVASRSGAWVLAPCPHDGDCPLHLSGNPRHFCHFSQRIERPKFLKDTKHTFQQEEDAKYSYVVIRRGERVALSPAVGPEAELGLEGSDQGIREKALEWPRIILPPHKCKGHVIFDVCSPSAQIERLTVPRSQGKQAYYDARKAFWGDCWPHGSKKVPLVKTLSSGSGSRGDRRRKKKMSSAEVGGI